MKSNVKTIKPANRRGPASAPEARRRTERVLTKQRAAITQSIAEALVIKDGDLFFLSEPDGKVPLDGAHGCGLYYHDCRYLDGYEMRVANTDLEVLAASAAAGRGAVHELTNPDIRLAGGRLLEKEDLGIKLERTIDGERLTLHDELTIQNFTQQAVALPLAVTFRTAFDDIFEVRGAHPERIGRADRPAWHDGALRFVYHGVDGVRRELRIQCSSKPDETKETTGVFLVRAEPRSAWTLHIDVQVIEGDQQTHRIAATDGAHRLAHGRPQRDGAKRTGPGSITHNGRGRASAATILGRSVSVSDDWHTQRARIDSGSPILNAVVDRSFRDLRILLSQLRDKLYFAAGVPWYVTLFGRDSLISALEALAYDPRIAEQTLRLLASYQSDTLDEQRDAEPGKIPHELRFGEMARAGELPDYPYYGTIDATPLFLIVLGAHADWTGDTRLFQELRGNVERALEWIDHYGDRDGDGYVEYNSTAKKGLANQGWKDSGDGIVNSDGTLAEPPIALVEVQGYVYKAKTAMAALYRRIGDSDRADRLAHDAASLRARFNHDYWLEDAGFFALARQREGRPVAAVSSNPGQALWCGIIDNQKALQTAARLMRDDMFNGWGVRTLSAAEPAYNPIGYHLGTVWPHDNALIAVGMRRYGFDESFHRIFAGILDAAAYFPNHRLPEVFSGFTRSEYGVPVKYPVACHPQAWAAGAVPYMITATLGLWPQAFDRRLAIVRPILPSFVSHLELFGLRVGDARVDLRFEHAERGAARAEVLKVDGELEVVIGEA